MGPFGTQEFHMNLIRISQETVQFHRKNAGTWKFSHVPNRPYISAVHIVASNSLKIRQY